MTTYRRRRKRLMSDINVVPYIDVMLVLLVIFMITAPLLTEGVKVELPQADARPLSTDAPEPFQLTVDRDGNFFVNDSQRNRDEVAAYAAAVMRRNPKTPFVVKGDKNAAYQTVIDAMVLLQQAGVDSVGLVTEPGEGG